MTCLARIGDERQNTRSGKINFSNLQCFKRYLPAFQLVNTLLSVSIVSLYRLEFYLDSFIFGLSSTHNMDRCGGAFEHTRYSCIEASSVRSALTLESNAPQKSALCLWSWDVARAGRGAQCQFTLRSKQLFLITYSRTKRSFCLRTICLCFGTNPQNYFSSLFI